MNIGNYGIKLNTYAVIAFVLAMFGQPVLAGLLLAFVVLKEKDEWTSRQCMQAFFLSLAGGILSAFGGFQTSLNEAVYGYGYYGGTGFVIFVGFIAGVFSILLFVLNIIGLVRVVKCNEANIPVLGKWAYKAFGKQAPGPVQNTAYYQPPAGGLAYGQPYAPNVPGAPGQNEAPYGAPQPPPYNQAGYPGGPVSPYGAPPPPPAAPSPAAPGPFPGEAPTYGEAPAYNEAPPYGEAPAPPAPEPPVADAPVAPPPPPADSPDPFTNSAAPPPSPEP